jgi:hypothetical protein
VSETAEQNSNSGDEPGEIKSQEAKKLRSKGIERFLEMAGQRYRRS